MESIRKPIFSVFCNGSIVNHYGIFTYLVMLLDK